MKTWLPPAFLCKEIQELPLRHHGDVLACGGQVRKIRQFEIGVSDLDSKLVHLVVRTGQEPVQHAEFVHDLKGRRVNGVTAKIAQEVGMLFQDDNIDPGTRQQEARHHSSRPTTGDAATG